MKNNPSPGSLFTLSRAIRLVVLALGLFGLSAHASSPATLEAYLKASTTTAGDRLGFSVAIDGTTAVVGAPATNSGAGAAYVYVFDGTDWTQQAVLPATNLDAEDNFGHAVAISGDTIVVGAPFEDSTAVAVDGDATDNSSLDAGAAYVFTRTGTTWELYSYLKAGNTGAGDNFGISVDISGLTIVVGASSEDGSSAGVDGTDNDDAPDSGAAYVYVNAGFAWSLEGYIKASNPTGTFEDFENFIFTYGDSFGSSVAVDGDTIVVGSSGESSSDPLIQSDENAGSSGAVYVFTRASATWTQQAYLKASNLEGGDLFGITVDVSGDTLVAGATGEASASGSDPTDNNAGGSGAAYVFHRQGSTWTEQGYLKASNPTGGFEDFENFIFFYGDGFGNAVAIDGDTVVVGSAGESSNATGLNAAAGPGSGTQADESAQLAGAAYAFTRSGTTWTQRDYIKPSNTGAGDNFGSGVGVSGTSLIVGAWIESSSTTGINSTPDDNAAEAGAAYVFYQEQSSASNSAPTDIALSPSSIEENNTAGATIGTLSTTDPDVGDSHTYELVSGEGSDGNLAFTITDTTLSLNGVADYESLTAVTIRVRVTDDGTPAESFEEILTVTFTDANDAPTDITLSNDSIAENNASDATIGTLTATDQDSGDSHTFTLVAGDGDTDNSAFTITGTTLSINAAADFETKSSYSIRIRATDDGTGALTIEKAVTVIVTDVNEAPTDIALSANTVAENNPENATIGTLSSVDPDSGNSHTYTLVGGEGDTDNGSFSIDGTTLKISTIADFETKSSYSIRIRSADNGALSFEKSLTITVVDANEAPSLGGIGVLGTEDTTLTFTAANFTDAYADPENTALVSITVVTKPASGTLALSGTEVSMGQVISATDLGNLTYTPVANANGDKTFKVTASDDGGSPSSTPATVTVSIAAVNDAPTFALKSVDSPPAVVVWGDDSSGQTEVPDGLVDVIAIEAGHNHTVALKSDGTVVTWGDNGPDQRTLPADLSEVTAIGVGRFHTVALKSDGTVVAWGSNMSGQSAVPAGLSEVTAIAAGYYHTVALKSDGTVVTWGAYTSGGGQNAVPVDLPKVKAIAATMVLTIESTVVPFGKDFIVPAGLSDVKAIATGESHLVALKNDGTVVTWGHNFFGQIDVPDGLSDVKAIAVGSHHTVALKNDGTVVAWGRNDEGQSTVPVGLSGVTAIAAGSSHTVAVGVPFSTFSPVVASNSGLNTESNVVQDISPGPADELEEGQTVELNVSNDSPGLFATEGQPQIDANGTLTFTPAVGPAGTGTATATVTVVAQDNGLDTPPHVNTSEQTFTITVVPEPTVTSIAPAGGGTAGGTEVTITGAGFSTATGVTIGGVAATSFRVVSDTSITCTTPAGPVGTASVVVTNLAGSNGENTLFTYLLNVPPSFKFSLSPVTLTGLNSPFGLAFDDSDNLYVANVGGTTVSKFKPRGIRASATFDGFNGARALAFDGIGNLYVADAGGTTVSRIDAASLAEGGTTAAVTLTGLNRPTALAFDRIGNLYVANYGVEGQGTTVSRFDAASLAEGATTASATLTGLSGPCALAFDDTYNLYVANFAGTTVSRFDAASLAEGEPTAAATLTGLSNPSALAFDGDGILYVANYGVEGAGTTVSKFAPGMTTALATLTGLNGARALAFDGTGDLYVANGSGTTVSRFDAASLAEGGTTAATTLTGLSNPTALAFDGSDTLHVSNSGNNTVTRFSESSYIRVNSNSGAFSGTQVTDILAGPPEESDQTVSFSVSSTNLHLFSTPPSIDATGTLSFTPADIASYQTGAATVTVTAIDSAGASSDPKTFQIHVMAGSFCPVAELRHSIQSLTLGVPPPPSQPVSLFSRASRMLTEATSSVISLTTFYALEELLGDTQEGERLKDLYWVHGAEIVQMMREQPALRDQMMAVMNTFQPLVVALLSTTGDEVQITQAMIDQLNTMTDTLLNFASPELAETINTERARHNGLQDFVGRDFTQWAEILQVPVPDTPVTVNNAPTDIVLSAMSVAENNAPNATVGDLTAADVDPGETHTFSLVAGEGDTDNASFNISGDALRLTGIANRDTQSSYSVRVRATDNGIGSLTYEKALTITVTEANAAPTLGTIGVAGTEDTTVAFTAANFTGAYNDPENTPLASIKIETLPASGAVQLSGVDVTLDQVITAAELDNLTYLPGMNENGAKTFTVSASDGELSSPVATVTMTLAAVNDTPDFSIPGQAPLLKTVINDPFGDADPAVNSSGPGNGFVDRGQFPGSETGGELVLTPNNSFTTVYTSALADAINPFQATPATVTYTFGDINFSGSGIRRLWVGYRSSGDTTDHFMGATVPGLTVPGLYLSVLQEGEDFASLGNLIAVSSSGVQSTLATWNWADPTQLSGLVVTLITSATTYELQFSGAVGGTPTFVTGAATGALTGMGTISGNFDVGIMNQRPSTGDTPAVASLNSVVLQAPMLAPYDVTATAGDPEQSVANFTTAISPGPADEAGQTVSFLLTGYDSTLFSPQGEPAIDASGTLTYTPADGPGGTTVITVVAQDDGGTGNGGVNTSAPQTFSITVYPTEIIVNNATELAAAIAAAGPNGITIALNDDMDLSGLGLITKNVTLTANPEVTLMGSLQVGSGGTVNLGGGDFSGLSITVTNGGTLMGEGSFSGTLTVQPGGRVAPGASPGTITADSGLWAGGAAYDWEINDPSGATGTTDLLAFTNALTISATVQNPFIVRVNTLTAANEPGALAGFDPTQSYAWTVAQAGSLVGFADDAFTLDTSGVVNDLADGQLALQQVGNDIQLLFTPKLTTAVVTGPSAGSYKAGDTLSFQVNFNAAITVSGSPQLPLTIGTTAVNATYATGSGGTALTFTYVVQAGDTDADGISTGAALVLNGGSMQSAQGVDAPLAFTPPALGGVLVDTTAPTISIGARSASITATGPVSFPVTYADDAFHASTLATGDVTLNKTGTADGSVAISGTGTTRTVTIADITGEGTLGITIGIGTASDVAGNLAPASAASSTVAVDPNHTGPIAPTIEMAPGNPLGQVGGTARFEVVAVGTEPITYAWYFDDVLIEGANSAVLTLGDLALAAAGDYKVVVSNSEGSVNATASLTVVEATATHALAGRGYRPDEIVTVDVAITYSGSIDGMVWSVMPPAAVGGTDWTLASAAPVTGATLPSVGATSLFEWTWSAAPTSPLELSYDLTVPSGMTGDASIVGLLTLAKGEKSVEVLANPDPLTFGLAPETHDADTDQDSAINLSELLRVIELYNGRNGTVRTGRYKVSTGSVDGFGPDGEGEATVLSRYHSADTSRDGSIDLSELLRLIELYNTRDGTVRTGAYRMADDTVDGFAPAIAD